jgi:TolA-binding protein
MKPDEVVERLTELARDATPQALTDRESAGIVRLERSLAQRPRGRRAPRRTAPVKAAVLLAAVFSVAAAVFLVLLVHERALTFEVAHGKVGEGGYVVAESTDAAVVRFSDHSELGLERDTRLRVSQLQVRGARVMLEGGLLHVQIRPRPSASWVIDAGPYLVRVTGTEFDVAWRVADQTLDLRLTKGSVVVEGPLISGGLRMQAGQHLVAKASDGSLSIADERAVDVPAAAPATPPPSEIAPGGPAPAPPAPSTSAVTTAAPHPSAGATWSSRVARGDFSGVLEAAERRGVDRTLAEASLPDLASVAAAARYERRADVARRALASLRTRFPGSVQARDAAFFLGDLAEARDDGATALESYETYLRESPNGPYASQALGRKLLLVQRSQGAAAARPLAGEYLERFPDGAYAPSARHLLQAQ